LTRKLSVFFVRFSCQSRFNDAMRMRNNKLQPHESTGVTFTI
jgi:hypothetical protein